jgi:hypothetical protein
MGHFSSKLLLFVGAALLIGSYFAIHTNAFTGVWMRWMGILALILSFAFRD